MFDSCHLAQSAKRRKVSLVYLRCQETFVMYRDWGNSSHNCKRSCDGKDISRNCCMKDVIWLRVCGFVYVRGRQFASWAGSALEVESLWSAVGLTSLNTVPYFRSARSFLSRYSSQQLGFSRRSMVETRWGTASLTFCSVKSILRRSFLLLSRKSFSYVVVDRAAHHGT